LIDVGCGTGHPFAVMGLFYRDCRQVGFDTTRIAVVGAVQRLRLLCSKFPEERSSKRLFLCNNSSDFENLELEEGSASAVYSFCVTEQMAKDVALLAAKSKTVEVIIYILK
jgi:hypothetical protein